MCTEFSEVAVGSAEKRAPAEQTFEVEVRVVLPGIADATEYLDRRVTYLGQLPGERLCPQGGQVSLGRVGVVGSPERMDHPAARQLDRLIHVGAQVLDCLKRTDGLAEL